MEEEKNAAPNSETPDGTVSTPETGTTGNGETPGTTATTPSSEEQIRRLESAISKANKDAKDHRFENIKLKESLAELAKFKEQIEAEKLSETEKRDLERKKLEQQVTEKQSALEKALQQVRDGNISRAVLSEAGKMNIVDPEAAILFIKADVELDENDKPTNIAELLKALVKERPWLLQNYQSQRQASSGGATNPSRSQANGQSAESLVARLNQGQLSSNEYNALPRSTRDEMQKIMSKATYR